MDELDLPLVVFIINWGHFKMTKHLLILTMYLWTKINELNSAVADGGPNFSWMSSYNYNLELLTQEILTFQAEGWEADS